MNSKQPIFILAGNGPYVNRGCEAIVRGTIEILRNYYDDPLFMIVSRFKSFSQFKSQKERETDNAIVHEKFMRPLMVLSRLGSRPTFKSQPETAKDKMIIHETSAGQPGGLGFKRALGDGAKTLYYLLTHYPSYLRMLHYMNKSLAVLSVGGDNYSLDYGLPESYTDLDDLVLAKKKPMIIWGASVGPFNEIPEYESYMMGHLKKLNGIFAREPSTIEYLNNKGVTKNVYRVADPAFLMKPIRPPREKFDLEISNESIGVNFSPLMAKYTSNGDITKWLNLATHIVEEISKRMGRTIYLIPHAMKPNSNDYVFLKKLISKLDRGTEYFKLIPDNLNAAETKWVISKMAVFAGARTHATIAAFSSGIPTLSFAYSIKARGINDDIYGHAEYCLEPHQLRPDIVAEKIEVLFKRSDEIKEQIQTALPRTKKLAMDAGKYLKDIIAVNKPWGAFQ